VVAAYITVESLGESGCKVLAGRTVVISLMFRDLSLASEVSRTVLHEITVMDSKSVNGMFSCGTSRFEWRTISGSRTSVFG